MVMLVLELQIHVKRKLDVNGKISTQDSLEIGPVNDMYKGLTVSKSNVKMVIGNSGGDGNYGSMQVFKTWKTKLQQVVLRHIIWKYSQMEEVSVLEPTNPTEQLEVNGNIKANGFKIPVLLFGNVNSNGNYITHCWKWWLE